MSSLKLSTHKMSIPKMSTPKESTKIYIWLNACISKLFHSYHFGTYGGSCMQQYNRLKGNSIKAHPEHLRAEWCLQKKVGCHWSDESWYFGSWHFGSWHFESWHFGSWHSEINFTQPQIDNSSSCKRKGCGKYDKVNCMELQGGLESRLVHC